ncbi:phosphonate ABC transporter, permease protein PhnE [Halobacterium salinarum]|uniref:Phosphonate transport system permease protein n=4 Tax=Halobacterium salinarum TaxID=2242 RepID=A0A841H938_HALSI|nr:phosphonate ABC transporter, permease protein PhnE [Halobacterium salinarum]AAG20231.1 transport protein [Halobacterium salinarum NRC-1]MBB6089247.1 phosphonate transport system permease protein [Halobacterium salinarum]MDL0118189.1 phosphonate ABC transporter, permease protein PhnE [Halobacterium salinarum]MDL0124990.1 phosphonate ABC transporter, permease protein PhnE [Halobacterium salinarum]MDL0128270.1 phosphonate ABC transporter, permease protein PhnE [Halobacterium salinarum]
MSTKPNEGLLARFGFGVDPDDKYEARLYRIKRNRTKNRIIWALALIAFLVLFEVALELVNFSLLEISAYWSQFVGSLRDFFPLTSLFGVVPFVDVGQYYSFLAAHENPSIPLAAVETLGIAFAGTVLGAPLALTFGVLGSERVTPFPLNFLFRGVMSSIRSIPALVWALIFIPLGGLSPFTATLAIGTDTIGNLGRLFTDALEEVEDGPIEGVESTGASRPQVILFGMLSQMVRPFIAWSMYILEINVRVAVTMGLINAGGIGEILMLQRQTRSWHNMMATIIVIFVLVVSVEMLSQRIRSRIRGNESTSVLRLFVRTIKQFPSKTREALT